MIGGVNDNDKEMQEIAEMLKDIKYASVELMPYHKMGEHKFEALGRTFESFAVPSKSDMTKFKEIINTKRNEMQ